MVAAAVICAGLSASTSLGSVAPFPALRFAILPGAGNGNSDLVGSAAGAGDLWVTNRVDGTVDRLDAATGKVIGTPIRVGNGPVGVAVGPSAVWVANSGSASVSWIDPTTGVVARTIKLGADPYRVAVDGNAVWVVGAYDGWKLSPTAGAVLATAKFSHQLEANTCCDPTRGIAVGPAGVWITEQNGTVQQLNPASGEPRGPAITVGHVGQRQVSGKPTNIFQMDVAEVDGSVWVGSWTDNAVTEINPATEQIVEYLSLSVVASHKNAGMLFGLAAGDGGVWTINSSDRVIHIDPATGGFAGNPIPLVAAQGPTDVTVGEGYVWVVDGSGGVYRIST